MSNVLPANLRIRYILRKLIFPDLLEIKVLILFHAVKSYSLMQTYTKIGDLYARPIRNCFYEEIYE